MTVGAPSVSDSSQAMIADFASATLSPSSDTRSLLEFIATPSPTYASGQASAGASDASPRSANQASGGRITPRIGSSNSRANSKSRSSCAGTAMIAPVP